MAKTLIEIAIDERTKQLKRKAAAETNTMIRQFIEDEIKQLQEEWNAQQKLGKPIK